MWYSGGIGKATALALARRGCNIAVHYNSSKSKADELVVELENLGVHAAAVSAELSDYNSVRQLHAEVTQKLGHSDILFNNAGAANSIIGPQGDIQSISIEEFEANWKLNTGSSYLVGVQFLLSLILLFTSKGEIVDTAMPSLYGC